MLHVPQIITVWYYKAPYGTSPSPRTIPLGRHEVEIITAGRGFYEYRGGTVEAVPGTILWHDPGEETIHLNDLENPYECIVIVFQHSGDSGLKGLCHWMDRVSLQVFIDNVLNEYHSENSDIAKLSYYVFGQLYWQFKTAVREFPAKSKRHEEIQSVINWIDHHFSQDMSIDRLADMVDLSVPHLHTVFRELVHQTPYQYIQGRRILEARKLLATTRLSVKEVCMKSGFNDLGNFCRLFKKAHGITAQEYRQLHADKR